MVITNFAYLSCHAITFLESARTRIYFSASIFIDHETREIIRLVASVRPCVCLHSNLLQDLCVFVSNQETFMVKSCAQRRGLLFADSF